MLEPDPENEGVVAPVLPVPVFEVPVLPVPVLPVPVLPVPVVDVAFAVITLELLVALYAVVVPLPVVPVPVLPVPVFEVPVLPVPVLPVPVLPVPVLEAPVCTPDLVAEAITAEEAAPVVPESKLELFVPRPNGTLSLRSGTLKVELPSPVPYEVPMTANNLAYVDLLTAESSHFNQPAFAGNVVEPYATIVPAVSYTHLTLPTNGCV